MYICIYIYICTHTHTHTYTHTMEYYSTLKKERLQCATAWMSLEDIMLSKMSHKKINTVYFHLYEVLRAVKIIETKSRTVVARG